MPELDFNVLGVDTMRGAAVPMLYFKLAIVQPGAGQTPLPIQSIALQCQIRIDATRRVYKPREKARLSDLFGEPGRWSRSLNSMLWTHCSVAVPSFEDRIEVDLPVACSFDFNLATTKYFHGLECENVPLLLLFSGTVFYRNGDGALAMSPISWNKELRYRLPFDVWQNMMDIYYPNQAWLRVDREVFDALDAYKRRHGLTGFDEALGMLLPTPEKAQAS